MGECIHVMNVYPSSAKREPKRAHRSKVAHSWNRTGYFKTNKRKR